MSVRKLFELSGIGKTGLSVLVSAFHRIYKIPIKPTGNDFADLKDIEQKVDVEVQVFDLCKKTCVSRT